MDIVLPPKLAKGDRVGVCSPSGTIAHKRDLFDRAKANFERATGLWLVVAPNAFAKHYYSAGTPEERVADFHSFIDNPDIKAVIFSAGGDTAIDLLPLLDYERIRRHPKIISGISDATTILSAILAKTGLVTFLGLEFLDFAEYPMTYELHSIEREWFQGTLGVITPNPEWKELRGNYNAYDGWKAIRPGTCEGQFVGGNLQSFLQLVGTEYELPFQDSILFMEAYKLPKKQIRKALMQLRLRGVFGKIKGLVVGYCLECENPQVVGNEQPLAETILEVTADDEFPIMQVGEIGHCVENVLQPIGAWARIDADKLSFEIIGNVTE